MNAAGAAAGLVMSWAVHYTRGLPFEVAANRRAELASDLYEQQARGRERGTPSLVVAWAILRRMAGGMADDQRWRHRQVAIAHRRMLQWDGERAIEVPTPARLLGLRGHVLSVGCLACDTRYPRRLGYCPVCRTPRGEDAVQQRGMSGRGVHRWGTPLR